MVVSDTVTVKVVGVAALPAASLLVQVTMVPPNANVELEIGVHDAVLAPSTASEVAGDVYATAAPDALVASAATPECAAMIGAVVSRTFTKKLLLPTFPAESVAEQVTSVVAMANVEPETGAHVTAGLAGAVSSVAVGVENTTAAPAAEVASAVTLVLFVTTGGVVSATS